MSDSDNGPALFCCEWVEYPQPGQDTTCTLCGSVFTVRAEPDLPAPNFYAADGPVYRQAALWSPDADAYASGQIDASQVTCALCLHLPCDCPAFGTAEYYALIDARHGRKS